MRWSSVGKGRIPWIARVIGRGDRADAAQTLRSVEAEGEGDRPQHCQPAAQVFETAVATGAETANPLPTIRGSLRLCW